mgnify:FL=1
MSAHHSIDTRSAALGYMATGMSLRDTCARLEEEQGVSVSHETVRGWWKEYGEELNDGLAVRELINYDLASKIFNGTLQSHTTEHPLKPGQVALLYGVASGPVQRRMALDKDKERNRNEAARNKMLREAIDARYKEEEGTVDSYVVTSIPAPMNRTGDPA